MDNVALAKAIRQVAAKREGSYDKATHRYGLSYAQAIEQTVGDDPIAIILACLFTAGYCEMYEYTDKVLGTE